MGNKWSRHKNTTISIAPKFSETRAQRRMKTKKTRHSRKRYAKLHVTRWTNTLQSSGRKVWLIGSIFWQRRQCVGVSYWPNTKREWFQKSCRSNRGSRISNICFNSRNQKGRSELDDRIIIYVPSCWSEQWMQIYRLLRWKCLVGNSTDLRNNTISDSKPLQTLIFIRSNAIRPYESDTAGVCYSPSRDFRARVASFRSDINTRHVRVIDFLWCRRVRVVDSAITACNYALQRLLITSLQFICVGRKLLGDQLPTCILWSCTCGKPLVPWSYRLTRGYQLLDTTGCLEMVTVTRSILLKHHIQLRPVTSQRKTLSQQAE